MKRKTEDLTTSEDTESTCRVIATVATDTETPEVAVMPENSKRMKIIVSTSVEDDNPEETVCFNWPVRTDTEPTAVVKRPGPSRKPALPRLRKEEIPNVHHVVSIKALSSDEDDGCTFDANKPLVESPTVKDAPQSVTLRIQEVATIPHKQITCRRSSLPSKSTDTTEDEEPSRITTWPRQKRMSTVAMTQTEAPTASVGCQTSPPGSRRFLAQDSPSTAYMTLIASTQTPLKRKPKEHIVPVMLETEGGLRSVSKHQGPVPKLLPAYADQTVKPTPPIKAEISSSQVRTSIVVASRPHQVLSPRSACGLILNSYEKDVIVRDAPDTIIGVPPPKHSVTVSTHVNPPTLPSSLKAPPRGILKKSTTLPQAALPPPIPQVVQEDKPAKKRKSRRSFLFQKLRRRSLHSDTEEEKEAKEEALKPTPPEETQPTPPEQSEETPKTPPRRHRSLVRDFTDRILRRRGKSRDSYTSGTEEESGPEEEKPRSRNFFRRRRSRSAKRGDSIPRAEKIKPATPQSISAPQPAVEKPPPENPSEPIRVTATLTETPSPLMTSYNSVPRRYQGYRAYSPSVRERLASGAIRSATEGAGPRRKTPEQLQVENLVLSRYADRLQKVGQLTLYTLCVES